jgi:O-glycosyl hydrolase
MGCPQSVDDPPLPGAGAPTITTQPAVNTVVDINGYGYFSAPALTVTATKTGGGAVGYQWYKADSNRNSGGTAIEGATTNTYQAVFNTANFQLLLTEPGVYYFYAVITSYEDDAAQVKIASNTATVVTYNSTIDARPPSFSSQPTNDSGNIDGPPSLSVVVADNAGNGTLTYQWYSVNTLANSGGTLISGATSATYQPSNFTAAGNYYFYVVVTNTATVAGGTKTAINTSAVVTLSLSSISVTIDISKKYQTITGVGGMSDVMFRAGNGANSPKMVAADIDLLFGVPAKGNKEIGLNILRMPLYDNLAGVLDGTSAGQKTEGAGNEGRVGAGTDYINIIKRVNQKGGMVYLCPWTPPVSYEGVTLKENHSGVTSDGSGSIRGTLIPAAYDKYAKYLRDYLINLNTQDAPVYAVSVQNEPDQGTQYESMVWNDTQLKNWHAQVGVFTDASTKFGPAIPGYAWGQATPRVLIVSGEHANDPAKVVDGTLNDVTAAQGIDIVAHHNYGYTHTQGGYALAHQKGKQLWQTEYNDSTGGSSSDHLQRSTWNWAWFAVYNLDASQRVDNEEAFVWWYLLRFYGLLGDGETAYNTTRGQILPRAYITAQYSRFTIGTTRVETVLNGFPADANPTTVLLTDAAWKADTRPRVSAYESADGNSVVAIIATPTTQNGTGGRNLGNVQIKLPWKASSAYLERTAVVSNAATKYLDEETVTLSADGLSAVVNVPAANIVSIKFIK